MDRSELKELYYIAPIDNVSSILQHGILSHARASKLRHLSVAMEEIQDRRAKKIVPGGRKLHEYVNLYICVRNPMLYKRSDRIDEICVLSVDTRVLDVAGVAVTNCNAASDYVRFGAGWDGLKIVDKQLTFAIYWTDNDPVERHRRKSAMCAEVLVPDRVHPQLITGAYVGSTTASAKLKRCAAGLSVAMNTRMFFRQGGVWSK